MLRDKNTRDMVRSGCELISYAEDMCDSDIELDDIQSSVSWGAHLSFNK